MDWMIVTGIVVAGWMILSVLSSERLTRTQLLATAANEKARADAEIPIAVSSDAVRSAIPASPSQPARKS